MAKCINCEHYPWKPDVDPGMMPMMMCHEKSEARRWTLENASAERSCDYFVQEGGSDNELPSSEPFTNKTPDHEPFVAGEASYSKLTDKAKELGIPFVGVKKEVLVAEIEALLNEGGEQDEAD